MLAKENRVTKKKDFALIFKKGSGFKEGFLFIKTILNKTNRSRFAFVVSQKVSKSAVVRNRIRRILKELVRRHLEGTKTGVDGVIVVYPGIDPQKKDQITEGLEKLFKKAKLIK